MTKARHTSCARNNNAPLCTQSRRELPGCIEVRFTPESGKCGAGNFGDNQTSDNSWKVDVMRNT
jgi:hypothetical protein